MGTGVVPVPGVPVAVLVGGLVVLGALVAVVLSVRWVVGSRRRMARVVSTTGVVTHSGSRSGGGGGGQPLTVLRIRYRDRDGVEQEGSWTGQDLPFQLNVPVGATQELRYDPEDPTWVLPRGRTDPVLKGVLMVVIGLLVAVLAATFTALVWVMDGLVAPLGP